MEFDFKPKVKKPPPKKTFRPEVKSKPEAVSEPEPFSSPEPVSKKPSLNRQVPSPVTKKHRRQIEERKIEKVEDEFELPSIIQTKMEKPAPQPVANEAPPGLILGLGLDLSPKEESSAQTTQQTSQPSLFSTSGRNFIQILNILKRSFESLLPILTIVRFFFLEHTHTVITVSCG